MNICPNCKKECRYSFCPECGSATTPAENNPTPVENNPTLVEKKRRSITVSGILCTLILAVFVVLLPIVIVDQFVHADGDPFLTRLASGFAGGACVLLLGLWLWGMVRWNVFAVPHTFRAMKSVVSRIIPLSLLALVVEIMFGIWLTLLPLVVYGMTTSPVIGVAYWIRDVESLPLALLLLALSAVAFWFVARKEADPIVTFVRGKMAARAEQI